MLLPRDGDSWEIGTSSDVSWLTNGLQVSTAITSAIPAVFAAYATVTDPDTQNSNTQPSPAYTDAVLEHLIAETRDQAWWLGFLDKPADVVFPDAPRVEISAGWRYVFAKAGPQQARAWRVTSWGEPLLPDVLFPQDRSWLLNTLWDDTWTCVGGSTDLVARLLGDSRLDTRQVRLEQDATPPGHRSR